MQELLTGNQLALYVYYIDDHLDTDGTIELQLILINEEKKIETPKKLKAAKRLNQRVFGKLFDGNLWND